MSGTAANPSPDYGDHLRAWALRLHETRTTPMTPEHFRKVFDVCALGDALIERRARLRFPDETGEQIEARALGFTLYAHPPGILSSSEYGNLLIRQARLQAQGDTAGADEIEVTLAEADAAREEPGRDLNAPPVPGMVRLARMSDEEGKSTT